MCPSVIQLAISIVQAASNPTHKPQYLITNIYCIQEQSFTALLVNIIQWIVNSIIFKRCKLLQETSIS